MKTIVAGIGLFISLAMLAILASPGGRQLVGTFFSGLTGLFNAAGHAG